MKSACLIALVLLLLGQAFPPRIEGPADGDPARYDDRRARAYRAPLYVSKLCRNLAGLPLLGLLAASGLALRLERRIDGNRLRWIYRAGFLAALGVTLSVIEWPARWLHWRQVRDFGMTQVDAGGLIELWLLRMPEGVITLLLCYLLVYCCMPLFGKRWWCAAAGIVFLVFSVVPEFTARRVPVSLIEKHAALPESPHRTAMQAVAERAGRPLEIRVADESRRTSRVKLYLTGRLGREFAVISDTWLEQFSPEESAAALAHELGHLETRWITLPAHKAIALVFFLLGLWLVQRRYPTIGEHQRLQVVVAVILVMQLLAFARSPLSAAVTRYQEREADRYARALVNAEALHAALIRTARINHEPWRAPAWVYALGASHPSLVERIAEKAPD